jgi:drug/metabolite transporter (DMT)-like permease
VILSLLVIAFDPVLEANHPSVEFLIRPWSTESHTDLLIMAALGVNAALGFYFLNKAYLSAPASKVAPFEYTYIIWAVIFGYVFWAEVPAVNTLIGVALLIGSNLYILYREIVIKQRQRRQQQILADPLSLQSS